MQSCIQIDHENCLFLLPHLEGKLSSDDLVCFKEEPITQKLLKLREGGTVEDPRLSGEDSINTLDGLKDVPQHILEAVAAGAPHSRECREHLHEDLRSWCGGQLKAVYALSAIFHLYFSMYELHQAHWGCQDAWLHLLRLRYRSLIELDELSRKPEPEIQRWEGFDDELAFAFFDWENFCRNPDNSFWFLTSDDKYPALQLQDIEGEIKAIISPPAGVKSSPDNHRWISRLSNPLRSLIGAAPYQLFLNGRGRNALGRLIHSWFLRDRFAWWDAVRLVLSASRGLLLFPFFGSLMLLAFLGSLVMWMLDQVFDTNLFPEQLVQWWLLALYIALPLWAMVGVMRWRPLADIMLPRVWAASLVGYLPLLTTGEIWDTIYGPAAPLWRVAFIWLSPIFASWLFLAWQMRRFLGASSSPWPVVRRASVILMLSLTISFYTGFMAMDLVGGWLGQALQRAEQESLVFESVRGALGNNIYLTALYTYMPFATFIGIIVQLFWQEKPVTE